MRKLIMQDLADCPVPAELQMSPSRLRHLLSEITDDLLRIKLTDERHKLELDELRKLATYANWLESVALVLPGEDILTETAIYVASSIRELLLMGNVGSTRQDSLQFLGTVLIAGASTHPAIGSILGKRCAEILKDISPQDTINACFTTIASLAARELLDCTPMTGQVGLGESGGVHCSPA